MPSCAGFIDEAGLRHGLHRLGVSLAPQQCQSLMAALPTTPEAPRIPLRDFQARLTDPGPAYHDYPPCFSPLRPGKGEQRSKVGAPLPPVASASPCEGPAAGLPPVTTVEPPVVRHHRTATSHTLVRLD